MGYLAFNDPSSRLTVEIHRLSFFFKYTTLPNVFVAIILASRLPRWTHYLFLTCYAYMCALVLLSHDKLRTGYVWMDFFMGATLGACFLNALHMLVLVDPWKVYRHKKDKPRALSWPERVYWAWCATVFQRGIGWNYQASLSPTVVHHILTFTLQVPHIQPLPRGRVGFSFHALRQVLFHTFLVDLVQTIHQNWSFSEQNMELISIRSFPYPQRIFYTATWFIAGYAGLTISYYMCALICVGIIGISEEEDWPPFFGSLMDAYSVRNFWGCV